MWRRFPSTLAALCLWAVATGVTADSRRTSPARAIAPTPPFPVITASLTIHGLERARQRRDGTLVVTDRISGTGEIRAGHVLVEGTVAPGNSPGCISFGGNATFSFTAALLIEIADTTPCSGYDQVSVANTLTISGATLEVVLLNGFVPQYGDRFDVLNWGTLTGSFGALDTSAASLPAPLVWDTSQLYLSGELVVGVQHITDGDLAPWNNPDGQVNAADVLIASQLALGLRTPGALQFAHGDMNLDGIIDLADLLLIQQAVLH